MKKKEKKMHLLFVIYEITLNKDITVNRPLLLYTNKDKIYCILGGTVCSLLDILKT